jgi:GT2 family glycosyltransferase
MVEPRESSMPAAPSQRTTPKAESDWPLVSIVVPTWNSECDLSDLLESVASQSYPKNSLELVIVDNGSTDGSVNFLHDWFVSHQSAGWHRLQLIRLSSNKGIAHAYNLGFEHCSPETFAVLRGEADVILESDVVEKLCGVLRNDRSIGVAGAKGILHGTVPPQLDHAANYVNWWSGRVKRVDPPHLVDCDSVLGPTFLARRSCINEMQFFFPADRFLANELEFCTRVKRSGYRVVCEPAAVSYHKGAKSTGNLDFGRFGYVAQRETVLFHLKYNPFPQKFFCLAFNAAYSLKQAWMGNKMPLLGLRDGFRWWLSKNPTKLPYASSDVSLTDWLVKS